MKCPKFGFEITDTLKTSYCQNCTDKNACIVGPGVDFGKVDVFKLAKGLAEKEEWEKLPQWAREGKPGPCPKCCRQSLFYNKYSGRYECLNLDCKQIFTKEEVRG